MFSCVTSAGAWWERKIMESFRCGSWWRLTKERLLVDELKLISVVLSDRAVYKTSLWKQKNITAREPYGCLLARSHFVNDLDAAASVCWLNWRHASCTQLARSALHHDAVAFHTPLSWSYRTAVESKAPTDTADVNKLHNKSPDTSSNRLVMHI